MKHPVATAVAAALALGLVSTGALRLALPPPPAPSSVEAVEIGAVWAAALPDLGGRSQPLAQWRGKVLVLNFWAPWCPPCRREIPGFIRLQQAYGSRGLQFVGVALDTPDKVAAYADAAGIPYPLLLGDEAAASLARAAGNHLGGLPYTVVFDRRGNAVASHTGALAEERLEDLVKPLL
ncbi:TlpA family protein disulfide reductase [Parasulfuritortus cantonensis]|uniref:TlpA family protein disulfide reductase n=1 Tax=Parasulfuritortus cantonensis TaxID=2528202 RepID=A0A4R1BIJ4_9PROT|nr:TlpA disulfide reductase family protein [Parasulfuritortus cantonensis]TCJ17103.1 TlpA family protein disulfide reductase [Parasulfuritortus cantonensis]